MDQPASSLSFKVMSFLFRLRDFLWPREEVLGEVGIQPGDRVLDYGCGPGGYVTGASRLAGPSGKVYALDIHPLAIGSARKLIEELRLTNVETIRSDCDTGLPDQSVNVALLYDIFHGLSEPDRVLKELHRVLKPDGVLSFSDHHMRESKILSQVTQSDLFELKSKGKRTYSFSPKES